MKTQLVSAGCLKGMARACHAEMGIARNNVSMTAGREGFLPAGHYPAGRMPLPYAANHVNKIIAARAWRPEPDKDLEMIRRNGQRGDEWNVAGAATIR